MSYLRQEDRNETNLPIFARIQERFGFIPNFYRAQTMRPDLIEAETNLGSALINKESALSRQQKEYIFLVCSAANLSTYCVTAHCEVIRMLKLQGPEPEQIAVDHTATNLPMTMKALLNFSKKLTNHPTKIGQNDIDALRTFGFTDEQILEAVVITAFAKFANCLAFGLGTLPDFDSIKIKELLGTAAIA
jgi:uncharacterized peroxidase-related enzyme